ncbi:MAG: hypothetical protein IK016_09670 [Lachnospiraceae bacterium]|nr:hypothetical protein [Lachnospiraceae bacterium]
MADLSGPENRNEGLQEQAAEKQTERRKSVIRSVFVTIVVLLVVSYAVLGVLLYMQAQKVFLTELKSRSLGIAESCAELVDAAAHARLSPGDENSADYQTVMDTLVVFRDHNEVQYVYTVKYDDEGIPVIWVDSDPDEPSSIGGAVNDFPETLIALDGTPTAADEPTTDIWGTHLSAYAPFYLDGEVVGAVGVDIDYTWIQTQLRRLVMIIVGVCLVCLAVSLLLLLRISRYLKSRFLLLDTKIEDLSFDAESMQHVKGLDRGDEFEMIVDHINEVFRRNAKAQWEEAEKLRSAMAEVERRAEERVAEYANPILQALMLENEADEDDAMTAGGRFVAETRLPAEAATSRQQEQAAERPGAFAEPRAAAGEETPAVADEENAAAVADAVSDAGAVSSDAAPVPVEIDLPEFSEDLSKEEAMRIVREAAPQVLQSYRDMIRQLEPYFGSLAEETEEDLPEMDPEELQELYEAVLEFAEMFDLESIDSLLRQTKGYRIPDAERERFEKVKDCVRESDWTLLKEVIGG